MFFDGWEPILRTMLTAPVVYAVVVLFIRISGKRSTSQMNNFDWIVTVAMGSIVASAIILKDIAAATALAGLGALLVLQWGLTKAICYWPLAQRAVRARATLLFCRGEFVEDNMHAERIVRAEILSAVREAGMRTLADVEAVVLEADAALSVIPKGEGTPTTLEGVEGLPDDLAAAIGVSG